MKKLFYCLIVYYLVIPGIVKAEQTLHIFKVKATIPPVYHMDVEGLNGWGVKQIQGTLLESEAQGSQPILLFPDAIQVRNLMSNEPVFLQVRVMSWNPPPELQSYHSPTPPKHELQMRVRPPWRMSGVLEPAGAFSSFQPIGSSPSDVLKIGDKRSNGTKVGCHKGSADMDARLVFENGEAVPGTYTIDLELTIRSQP